MGMAVSTWIRWGAVGLCTSMACGGSSSDGNAGTEAATGTVGDTDPTGSDDSTGEVVIVTEIDVPADGPRVELQSLCFDAAADATYSASPEGLLWVNEGGDTWRILDPLGGESEQSFALATTDVQGWTDRQLYAIADGQLWDVQAGYPQPLAWPEGLAAPTAMCGDPGSDANGFVVADGLLQRDRGQWWSWVAPGSGSFAEIDWIAEAAGACIGTQGETWLSAAGLVWRITPDFAGRVETLDGASAATFADELGVAAIVDGNLAVGGPEIGFSIYDFGAGDVVAVAGGGPTVWIVAGASLYRLTGADELPVAVAVDGADATALSLAGDASGSAWIVDETGACHLREAPPIRVGGLHHLQRRDDEMLTFHVEAPATSAPSAVLDGTMVNLTVEQDGVWLAAPSLLEPGWHTLEIDAVIDGAMVVRTLEFEQRGHGDLTFTDDIEPLFAEHCSGAVCHGPDVNDPNRPDLTSYEAWLDKESSVLARVVSQGDMPPFSVRAETWTLDSVLTIFEWYETGAPQQEQ